jgi:hypothetical protein
MSRKERRFPNESFTACEKFDGIIGTQSMAFRNQLQSTFGFPDSRFPDKQNSGVKDAH